VPRAPVNKIRKCLSIGSKWSLLRSSRLLCKLL